MEKVVLFIDAENISYRYLSSVLEEIPRYGKITLKVAYGNWESPTLTTWHDIASAHGIRQRHQTSAPNTKNATDMRLIMDAMDVLYHINFDTFCLVSNDADYIPLCEKLRENNKRVIGMGYPDNASGALIRTCDSFFFINHIDEPTPPVPEPTVPKSQPKSPQNEQALVIKALNHASSNNGTWVPLATLGTVLREVQPNFDVSHYEYATLSKLLHSMPDVVEITNKDNRAYARLKDDTRAPARAKKLTAQNTPKTSTKKLRKLINTAFEQAIPDKNGWVTLSSLGTILRQVHPGFESQKYGHATLSKLLLSMPDLIELNTNNHGSARLKPTTQPQNGNKKLQKLITTAMQALETDDKGWTTLSALGSKLREQNPGFTSKNYKHATLSKLLKSMPKFISLRTDNKTMYVRLN